MGVLSQCNCGLRRQLTVAGVPVGMEMPEELPAAKESNSLVEEAGSIIIVIATDAPLLPHQLKRLARRASMGLARTGSTSGNGSGDIFLAFSTANPEAAEQPTTQLTMLSNSVISPLFDATVQATEESIINALVAAETMTGIDNHRVTALSHSRLREVMKKYQRLL